LAVIAGEQLQEAAHALLNPTQPHQGQQGLALALALNHRLQQGGSQGRVLLDLTAGEAEQIGGHQGARLLGLHPCQGITEGFVGARQAEQQIVAVDRDRPQLDHAAHDQPDVLAQQGHAAAGGQAHEGSPAVAGVPQRAEAVRWSGVAGWRGHHGGRRR
ncbi:MAG: hypothetical protein ACK55I_44890, partial [bacterium]